MALREQSIENQVRVEQTHGDLSIFFAQSIDAHCIAGFDGYFKRLNPAWTTNLGWTKQELLARPFIEFVHPDDCNATLAQVGMLAEGRETIRFENRYLHKNGAYHWLRWNAVVASEQIYGTARDITRQHRLERKILEIVDQEKASLGRELHDSLCQSLAGIAALSSALSRRLEQTSESDASKLAREITQLLNETIGDTRDMARGLGPIGLGESGLGVALQTLTDNVEHMFRVPCALEVDPSFPRVDPSMETHVFRIAQEALNNAVTHGRADRIDVTLRIENGNGVLSICDNGIGFDVDAKSGGNGLQTMAYRARLICGIIEVRRRPIQGIEVICTFPIIENPDTAGNHVSHT